MSRPQSAPLVRPFQRWVPLAVVALVVVILSAAKAVLIPLALAAVLTFILTPPTRWLQRWGAPRALAVGGVVLLALAAVAGFGVVLANQVDDLSRQFSRYASSMQRKLSALRGLEAGPLERFQETLNRLASELEEKVDDTRRAAPVRVVPSRRSPADRARDVIAPLLSPLATALVVVVLTVFMLSQREDLRNRLLRLGGLSNLSLTTRTMDEVARRIGRFLVTQTLINAGFGTVMAAGLYLIGVPYAALWGFAAAVLRFIPYVGSVLALLMPATLAFALFPGWTEVVLTVALFIATDMTTAYFVEPVLVGQRTGVAPMAILVAAVFWTWLWGPIGLVLTTPLTVCLVVLGRQLPPLHFLAVLLGDQPVLAPEVAFYQRLLAHDEDEALEIAEQHRAGASIASTADDVLLPALTQAAKERIRNDISDEDLQQVVTGVRDVLHQWAPPAAPAAPTPGRGGRWLGVAARGDEDRALLEVLDATAGVELPRALGLVSAEEDVLARMRELAPSVVVVGAIPPAGGERARSLCRLLRAVAPTARLLVLRPALPGGDPLRAVTRLKEAGADVVVPTVGAAREQVRLLLGHLPSYAEAPAVARSPAARRALPRLRRLRWLHWPSRSS